jgi:hypothetical protein
VMLIEDWIRPFRWSKTRLEHHKIAQRILWS